MEETKTNYQVVIYNITFALSDDEGCYKEDESGKAQQYDCKGRLKILEYLCEDMTEDDLIKITN